MKVLAIFFTNFLFLCSSLPLFAQADEFCLASQQRQELWQREPEYRQLWVDQNEQIRQWLVAHAEEEPRHQLIVVPVVVHIVWNSPEENLPDAEIMSQIEALNRDFRALNDEVADLPLLFKALVADVEIEFCLAGVDPAGQPTTGITRTFTNNDVGIGGTTAIHYTALGGEDAWDPSKYLNIWVAKFAGGVSGTASFPGQGPAEEDGVEINYRFFGTLAAEPPYNLGRTLTHEVGHYFNLEHPWGPNISDCCGDDFVADTPEACETYLGQCPVHPVVSCDEPDMFMNYMFYTDDACMGMFTLGQKARMLAALNLFRSGLINAGTCFTAAGEQLATHQVRIYPNPATEVVNVEIDTKELNEWELTVFDFLGRRMTRQTFSGKEHAIEVGNWPKGVYLLFVRGRQQQYSAHFLKQ